MSLTIAPTLTTKFVRRDLPTLSLPDLEGDYTTPAISVPPNDNNPYILKTEDTAGTVFIAVGSIVGAILLGFILYHLFISFTASRLAKKAFKTDKEMYEKYHHNNNTAYGLTPSSSTLNFMNSRSGTATLSNFPLLSHHASKSVTGLADLSDNQLGDTSTLYQSEVGAPTTKNDLTKMFVSPTAEVMSHKKMKSGHITGSIPSFNSSSTNLNNSPVNNRHSTIIPNLYIDHDMNNSDYTLSTNKVSNSSIPNIPSHLQTLSESGDTTLNSKPKRKTIPSMYLEDLIDE
ncbi:hypothetical protein CLIB1444_11S02146 [[Candida] jaroonii]|uniref:Uncharacterized protein n=1 Tax=[Candida] jaroonii TaxID=467808 RepID=A0ACA9YCR6_9ASCO|nr:hypothetical protein CLIB1444_11S02146 [[Candida] jaroonii]